MIKGDTIHLDREGTVASGSVVPWQQQQKAERPRFPEAQEAENKGN